jgi:integration host factor subunit beta
MLKSALMHRISSRNPHLYQRDVEKVLKAILDQIVGALARGDRVELRGFGVFSTKLRKARTGRNPRTGVAVSVAQKAMPSFKAAKEMQNDLIPKLRRWIEQRERSRNFSQNLRMSVALLLAK